MKTTNNAHRHGLTMVLRASPKHAPPAATAETFLLGLLGGPRLDAHSCPALQHHWTLMLL
eukprot:1162017-Pelagomonas_calceolata.AAC.2